MGSFDGLHRGHQEIIKRVVTFSNARNLPSVTITFDPHPRHILDIKKNKLPLLMNLEHKLKLLDEFQINVALVIPFTEKFSRITAIQFMDQVVVNIFNPEHITIGYDHHFGHGRDGSPVFLKDYCKTNNIGLEIVEPVSDEGLVISSTNIRNLIQSGFVRRASFELGWVYGFEAEVVHGMGRGRTLYYPTANFIPIEKNQLLPKNGVYLTRGRVDGQQLYGMCNLGVRPTFEEGEFVMEVHFFDPGIENFYGRHFLIEFLERIRDEKKFNKQDELIEQLRNDEKICRELQGKYS
jgi:riboflavin kinase/FMN adenylyltransferase